jgi:Asp-tRNA(Asn)/Glu-tRNA(Gln) amidotransferase A subunit family amidase
LYGGRIMKNSRRDFLKATGAGSALLATAGLATRPAAAQQQVPVEDNLLSGGGAPSGVTEQTFAEAEKLHGLEFTPSERSLMLSSVNDQVEAAKQIRALEIPNDGPAPANMFDPRLPQTKVPQDAAFRRSATTAPSMPGSATDIAYAPVSHLSHWVSSGQITSRRLTEIYLERIGRYDGQLHAFVTVTGELALAQADVADKEIAAGNYRGPLHGIPYGVKDLCDTKGIPTTWGATPYKERVPDSDAAVVRKLRDAGAVLLGKTTLGALAYDDLWWGGRTRNPWNTEEGSSGSSAGSGSSVASALVGFAIGTETLGSISSPSARNGVTGLRPTFGRVSRHGSMALCWSLDKIGPMCRAVEDTALVLDAIGGYDPKEAGSTNVPFNFDGTSDAKGSRLGYVPQWFDNEAIGDQGRHMLDTAEKAGMELVEISLPEWPYGAMLPVLLVEAAAAMEELTLSGRDDLLRLQASENWPNTFRLARFVSAVDLIQMNRFRRQVMEMAHEKFEEVDGIIGPSNDTPMSLITNYTGHPAITIRGGLINTRTRRDSIGGDLDFDGPPSDKLYEVPVSLTIWGPLYEDGRVCSIGMALEKEFGIAAKRPPGFS